MLSLPTRRGPATGSLKTPVSTVFPCHGTSFGMPTLTDSRVPTGCAASWTGLSCVDPAPMLTRLRRSHPRGRPAEYLARRSEPVQDWPVVPFAWMREGADRPTGPELVEHPPDVVARDGRLAGRHARAHPQRRQALGDA